MKSKILIIFVICSLIKAFSAIEQREFSLKKEEIQKLLPLFQEKMLQNHELMITGKEREIIEKFLSILGLDGLGRNSIYDEAYMLAATKELKELRLPENHKKSLEAELKIVESILKQDPNSFNCTYSLPPSHIPHMGTIKCTYSFRIQKQPGCFYIGNFSIPVDPKTKVPNGTYRSTLDSKEAYFITQNCPG